MAVRHRRAPTNYARLPRASIRAVGRGRHWPSGTTPVGSASVAGPRGSEGIACKLETTPRQQGAWQRRGRFVCGDGKTYFGEERLKLNRQIHLHLKLHSRRSPLSCISCRGSRAGCWRGGTQGGLNGLTHVLPRCLPTPTEEADGNGYGVIAGRAGGGPSRSPPRASVNLVPLL